MGILSIDLAYRDYRDIGVAVLEPEGPATTVTFLPFPGRGAPTPEAVAGTILELAGKAASPMVLIDGPQGWKDPASPFPHSRICERRLNTPAKTGLPGQVKPANYAPFVAFSIQVFDALAAQGWSRFSGERTSLRQVTIESFPLSAWRSLKLPILPAKAKARSEDLLSRTGALVDRFNLILTTPPNHDELQALVSGLAGLELLKGPEGLVAVEGVPPFELEGTFREGFIVNPR